MAGCRGLLLAWQDMVCPDLVCGHFHTALLSWQGHNKDGVARQLCRKGHTLPILAGICCVQQDGRLAADPALLPIEGYGVEAVIETCMIVLTSQACNLGACACSDTVGNQQAAMLCAHPRAHEDGEFEEYREYVISHLHP